MTAEERGFFRSKEIGGKAVASILVLLLKWFKISRGFLFSFLSDILGPCACVRARANSIMIHLHTD